MENLNQNRASDVVNIITEIIQGINSGETVVFCGAGISKDSGLPIVKQFVPYILEKLEIPQKDIELILDKDNNPKIPFEAFMEALQENSKADKIFDIYDQGEPNTNHILLAKLIKAGKVKTIITTNFDKLIEKALGMEALEENKNYDVIYKEEDFEKINWSEDSIRIIKIHGSVDDKEAMAITLKRVASQVSSTPRKGIIEEVFNKGKHSNVLILGYSSSDIFDLSPQIEAIKENHKKVYYVQHSDNTKVEDIQVRKDKNSFKKFKGSQRIYYNTSQLIKILWESIIDKYKPYELKTMQTNWTRNVDEWYKQAIKERSIAIRFIIPANIYLKIGEFKTAIEYYKQALKIAIKIGYIQLKVVSLSNLGNAYSNIGEYNKAIEYYEQALKIEKEFDDKKGEGSLLGSLGIAYDNLGEYIKAIEYYEQALKIAKEIGDKNGEGLRLGNLGRVYANLGEYNKAIEYNKQTLKITKEIGDKQDEGVCFGNLGRVYANLGEYNKAVEYYKQALKIAKEIFAKKDEGIWLIHLGSACCNLGEYIKAIEYYKQALKIEKEFDDKKVEGFWLGNLGIAFDKLGEYNKAIEYYKQALKIAKKIGDKNGEGLWLGNLGIAFDKLGEYNKAIEYYEQALDVLKSMLGYDHPHTKTVENNLSIAKSKLI